MLDANLKTQLQGYLTRITMPIELVASLDDSAKAQEMRELLEEIAALCDKIRLAQGDDARKPSFAIKRVGSDIAVHFAGLPMGHEFNSLVLALLQVGGHPSKEAPEILEQIRHLEGDFRFETWFSLSCQNCPDVVQALNLMSALNPRIQHVAIDGAMFQDEAEARKVMAVPSIYLNGEPFAQGRMGLEQILAKLDTGAAQRASEALKHKGAFDMLAVGGGPAGAAAGVYAARKGIRTGIVADRFGGQVLDTMGIENLISVPHTEGPKLVAAMEQHVKEYDVDIMNLQTAVELIPASRPDGLVEVKLASGATLKSKTVILSTGARWRQMNVPGEEEYRNKGVAYCPHCDGPLFKGKRVAVIGGGNSGVEAAIDLAGACGPCHPDRIRHRATRRRRAAEQAALAQERLDPHPCPDHAGAWRWRQGEWARLEGSQERAGASRRARRNLRADRPCAQHRMAEGRRGLEPARRDRGGCARPDLRARRLRGGRRDDHALQADRHRHGRRREGGAIGLRSSDPHGAGADGDGGLTQGGATSRRPRSPWMGATRTSPLP